MRKKKQPAAIRPAKPIKEINIEDEMKQCYLAYSLSVIMDRALPDVRDGLKPVHRRILYAMNELGMTPDKPFRKSARIVGEVLGKYHPHGDSSVYDAMVRMAQDFSTRYMPVQGQGNFGSVDGDGAAAMRYTEARLNPIAVEMLKDINKDTVEFRPNFDSSEKEPETLPCPFPNLLVNGTSGIAVGMASKVPPHNIGEVCDAAIKMLGRKNVTVEQLMEVMPGPDFPTGGIINGNAGIIDAYTNGHGKIKIRGKVETEKIRGNREALIITELPYECNKAKLVESIAKLAKERSIGSGISDIRDESGRDGIRIAIDLKKNVNSSKIRDALYKWTDLESTFGFNFLAIVGQTPKQIGLIEYLDHFLAYRRECLTRKARYELGILEDRIEVLEGIIKILDDLDRAIAIIRRSKTSFEAKIALIQSFELNERQAIAVLDMRLHRLTAMEIQKVREEIAEKREEMKRLQELLASEDKMNAAIRKDLREIKKKYGDPRRTEIQTEQKSIEIIHTVEKKPVAVEITQSGYIGSGDPDKESVVNSRRADDLIRFRMTGTSLDVLVVFTDDGKIHRKNLCEMAIETNGRKLSPFISAEIPTIESKIVQTFLIPSQAKTGIVMVTEQGKIKRMPFEDYTDLGRQCVSGIKLKEGDRVLTVEAYTDEMNAVCLMTNTGKGLCYPLKDVPLMHRNAAGSAAMKIGTGQRLVMAALLPAAGLYVATSGGYIKNMRLKDLKVGKRAGKGILLLKATGKAGEILGGGATLIASTGKEDIAIPDDGTQTRKYHNKGGVQISDSFESATARYLPESGYLVILDEPEGPDDPPDTPAGQEWEPMLDGQISIF